MVNRVFWWPRLRLFNLKSFVLRLFGSQQVGDIFHFFAVANSFDFNRYFAAIRVVYFVKYFKAFLNLFHGIFSAFSGKLFIKYSSPDKPINNFTIPLDDSIIHSLKIPLSSRISHEIK